jgi:response regulator RpfG family c-di-GMP phosphodiesterase
MMAGLLLFTQFLSDRRKWILILMELAATFLLGFDRAAYIYKGDMRPVGAFMVRISNFMVFFLTSAIVMVFNWYLTDLLRHDTRLHHTPRRLKAVNVGAAAGMALVVISQFTGLYYYFDEHNLYHRGPGFLLCYLIPVIFPLIQFTVIYQYRQAFSRLIYTSLVLYIFVPILVGIVQIFTYGISIVNMAMVLVSVSLYIFTYLDVNDAVRRAHEIEVGNLQQEHQSMKRLFDQTVTAFVAAVEKRDTFAQGHSVRVAEYARRIAANAGKNEEECDEVYYAALLHDVGLVGIPDAVIQKTDGLTEEEMHLREQKPLMSAEILSGITEYPYLSHSARYSHERYDGMGYPEGLAAEEIPEISRIIAVADAYDTMMTGKRTRAPLTYQVVREEFVKETGLKFDPVFAKIMVNIMDADHVEQKKAAAAQMETELFCSGYRETVSSGIRIEQELLKIRFECEPTVSGEGSFSAPSIIVFDSYDRHVHGDARTIKAYQYLEYAEIWFDGHYVATNARNMDVHVTENPTIGSGWELLAGRYDDHLSIRMRSPAQTVDIILALPDTSKASYIGMTGENCHIYHLNVEKTGQQMEAGSIRKIVSKIRYTDRLESDLPNLQIDHARNVATEGIPIREERIVDFHTMSLPSANLIWHCPYIVLFDAKDGKVQGEDYKEYALIKLNGESTGDTETAENKLVMKKTSRFPGWDAWKARNKEGMECSVRFERKGNQVTVITENLGIYIEHTMILHEKAENIYAALTGDQVALTDIRLR